ncbi:DUF5000 domain-containing lipoprotein [Sunxiuqinia sp. A32]|uniref:DUF5000 domain-containing lipoprotein n=1 Tax=Sunxiuqinia sp. A32 TaxID=3461496 RepID=UPI004045568D
MNKAYFNNIKNVGIAVSLLCLIVMGTISCDEASVGQIPTDNIPPSGLSNVVITPEYGGGLVSYDLPKEVDISYVRCEYENDGKKCSVNSSVYNSSLKIEGLSDTTEMKVSLYVADHSENLSESYETSFTPLPSPMKAILESFVVTPTYGGTRITWENPAEVLVGISFLAANDEGDIELQDIYYTSAAHGTKSLHGFTTDKRLFALSLVDKYENNSDTVKVEISPLYEEEFDKEFFADGHLNGDNISTRSNRPVTNLWDGTTDVIWHTDPSAGYSVPQFFTVDLGVTGNLSRFVLWERYSYAYSQHNLRLFDVYGTDSLTHEIDDEYYADMDQWKQDWKLLSECEVVKPSGSRVGTNTEEDLAASKAGFNFDFNENATNIRYLRFVVKETWAKTTAMHAAEISVFGDARGAANE